MGLTLVTAPATEPVTLTEAKAHLRVDGTDDDTLITSLIVAARESCEHETRRAFVTQTWRLTLDAFPSVIRLPRPALIGVSGITYVDPDGGTQTLATNQYTVITDRLPGEIRPAYDVDWPNIRAVENAVSVTYTAGYGNAAAVPSAIKAAILLTIGDLYANRETSIVGTIRTENPAAAMLLGPYVYREAI